MKALKGSLYLEIEGESPLCWSVSFTKLNSCMLTRKISFSAIYFLVEMSLWPFNLLIKVRCSWDDQHFQIVPSFFRSGSHYWNLEAMKAVCYKLTDAKMCECDMNIPLRYQGTVPLPVLWLFVRKWLHDAQPHASLPGPSVALSRTVISFPKPARLRHITEQSCPAVEELAEN